MGATMEAAGDKAVVVAGEMVEDTEADMVDPDGAVEEAMATVVDGADRVGYYNLYYNL